LLLSAATKYLPETAEEIREVREGGSCTGSALTAGLSTALSSTAEVIPGTAIVLSALLRVGEYLVGLLDLFKALDAFWIVRVGVGVILAGKLAVCTPDIILRRALLYPENLVEIFGVHPKLAL
jgi:hypothetical protein